MHKLNKLLFICSMSLLLNACSSFFDTDNTPTPSPLVPLKPEVAIKTAWSTSSTSGVGKDYLVLPVAISNDWIYTASHDGVVAQVNRITGQSGWRAQTHLQLTSGPAAHGNLVIVASRDGDVMALNQTDGSIAWQAAVNSEVLAPPALNANAAFIKALDGKLTALDVRDGHILWHYQETEPSLMLRRASAPLPYQNSVITGFANGHLVKLTANGAVQWQQIVAEPTGSFTIQRMVDIDADPIVYGSEIYAATYQGRIAALEASSGQINWTHALSTYTGIAADSQQVYVTDATGFVYAFNRTSGAVNWRQTQLQARVLTGPAVMGNYVVVADAEGYLHWLDKRDGHFVARVSVGGAPILANPIVQQDVLYVVSSSGRLTAYTF